LSDPPTLQLANGFVLDGWREGDAAAHRRFSVDPDAARFLGGTVAEAEQAPDEHYADVVRRLREEWRVGTRLSLAIREHAASVAIGAVELRPRGEEAEVSYLVEPASRGRGLASLALDALLGWARDELGLRRAVLTCHIENVASQRVAARCGFRFASRTGDELRYARSL
jgi:RimJ/RimL family protein N-acetyltransferase